MIPNFGAIEQLVLRLRDARARVRLGLPLVEELDALFDEAAEQLEDVSDFASSMAFARDREPEPPFDEARRG